MSAKLDGSIRIAGYQIRERLYSSSRTQVYRAVRDCDRQPVIIKLLKREYPSFSELVQFSNQYAIAKNLDIPSIIKPYSLELYQNGYALVMEDFGGISLREFSQGQSLTLKQFLPIALQLVDSLHELHQQHVIHKDIKPAHILIHPDTREIKLIDFSIASLLPRETQEIQSPNGLEGTLLYLSPEQTGRMNRSIDYRSDFYSLGVTFFELLSGQLPFESHEPMELVHCHIAKQPDSICNLNSEIPLMLGEIICKLMAKNAENRYQSALGLKYDLVTCLEQWWKTGKHSWFDLGQHDNSDRFLIREKLYGREPEVETLLEAFGRVANGASELMLVAGFSGIGKTAVVNEVHKPIVRWNGYFIKGKYDQFNRNIPLSAFVQAFGDLMAQLLSQSDAQLEQWRNKILSAMSESGQVMIEVIPELEQIIGKQPPAPELSGNAAQNRFNLLFVNFIQVFTTIEHPLVLFLDDLQWADSASLNLIRLLMGETLRGYLLIIGAYRDNEVFAAHPLMLTVEQIEKEATVSTITLAPLSQTDVNRLIADTLSCSTEVALPLTGLVYQKAKGNPFFTTQFLKVLHEEGGITFDWHTGLWQFDLGLVPRGAAASQETSLALTDNVVEFMAIQLQKLPNQTQALHQVATEAAYLGGDLEQMAGFASLVLNHAKTPLDQISIYEVKIEALTAQGQFARAIATALAILKQLGVELPAAPTQDDVADAFSNVSDVIGERLPAELLNLSEAIDANILAAARILTSVAPSAYVYQPLLYLLVILKKVYLSVVYGNESTSTFSYASYAILMCGVLGKVELGYEFGQLALNLLSRYQNSELKGKTLLLVCMYTRHWKMHLRETLHPLQIAYCSCLDVGDLAFAGYSAYNYGFYSYFTGQNLRQLELEIAAYCEALKHLKQNLTLTHSQLIRQILLNLMGDADDVVVLSGAAYNEQHQLPLHQATGDRTGLALLWINKLVMSYLFSDFEQAVEQAGQARQYLDAILAFFYVPIFHFYESLAQLAWYGQLSAPEQQQIKECIAGNQEKLNYWAAHAPMNFQHKFDLVEAERYRVLGNRAEAIDYYDRAIKGAKEQGYIQEEALANELAAKFYFNWGKERIAQDYMIQAYYGYARWGAKAKVADLEKRYPQLLAPILQQTRSPLSTNETIFTLESVTSTSSATSSSSASVALDLATILKVSQTLSGEIELEKLLSVLLHIVIENAGADKCVFMLLESGRLLIQASAQLSFLQNKGTTQINFYPMLLNPEPVEDSVELPVSLINTVKRSLQPAVIIDATVHPQLINDPYIQQQQPKSVLCSPILDQGKLLGVLYLENNLATGAFTSDRVELLNLLCAQVAISLQNAQLYRNSQNSAQQLTQN